MMQVTITLPDKMHALYADRADRYGMSIGQYLQLAVYQSHVRLDAAVLDVIREHTAGYNDGAIAAHLGITRDKVRSVRRRFRLPANWGHKQPRQRARTATRRNSPIADHVLRALHQHGDVVSIAASGGLTPRQVNGSLRHLTSKGFVVKTGPGTWDLTPAGMAVKIHG